MLVSNKPNVHNQDGDRSRHFEVFLSLTTLQRPFHDMTSVSGKTKKAIKHKHEQKMHMLLVVPCIFDTKWRCRHGSEKLCSGL